MRMSSVYAPDRSAWGIYDLVSDTANSFTSQGLTRNPETSYWLSVKEAREIRIVNWSLEIEPGYWRLQVLSGSATGTGGLLMMEPEGSLGLWELTEPKTKLDGLTMVVNATKKTLLYPVLDTQGLRLMLPFSLLIQRLN
jgi:hypothetical protein